MFCLDQGVQKLWMMQSMFLSLWTIFKMEDVEYNVFSVWAAQNLLLGLHGLYVQMSSKIRQHSPCFGWINESKMTGYKRYVFLSLWTTFKIASQILHIFSVCATTKELHSTISWSLCLNKSICFLSLNEFKNLNDVMERSFSLSRPSKLLACRIMISLSGFSKP